MPLLGWRETILTPYGRKSANSKIRHSERPTSDLTRQIFCDIACGGETMVYLASSPDVATTTEQYFYKCVPTTPSLPARNDRSALLLWQRSAVLAGMKENGSPPL